MFVNNEEANKLNRDSKVNSNRGVGVIGQYFSENDYANYVFYIVSKRFNNLLPQQNHSHYLCFSVTVRTNKFTLKQNEKYLSEMIKFINI